MAPVTSALLYLRPFLLNGADDILYNSICSFSPVKEATEGDKKQYTQFSTAVVIVLLLLLLIASMPFVL